MVDKISILKNVGQFDNFVLSPQTGLNKLSLIYAENGRGKTTMEIFNLREKLENFIDDIINEKLIEINLSY